MRSVTYSWFKLDDLVVVVVMVRDMQRRRCGWWTCSAEKDFRNALASLHSWCHVIDATMDVSEQQCFS